jgi:hypothetical protein
VVRQLAVALVLLFPATATAQTICGPQNYDLPQPPDFTCPSPDESGLVPDLNPPPSISVQTGWKLLNAQGQVVKNIEYDGAIVHRDKLIEMGLKLHAVRRLRWADRLRLKGEYDVGLQHCEDTHVAEEKLLRTQRDDVQARLTVQERLTSDANHWSRSWMFGFLIGFLTMGLTVMLAAYALSAL